MDNSINFIPKQLPVADRPKPLESKFELIHQRKQLLANFYHWSAVLTAQPDLVEGYINIGNILLDLGQTEQATEYFEEARRRRNLLADHHRQSANRLFSLRCFEDAYNEWVEILKLCPGEYNMHHRIQDVFFQEGQLELAQNLLQKIIDQNFEIAKVQKLNITDLRFLRLYSNQIGHLGHLDWYIKMTLLGKRNSARPVILAESTPNPCYLNYWKQYIPDILVNDFATEFISVSPYVVYLEDGLVAVLDANGEQKADYYYATQVEIQKQWASENRPSLLKLSEHDAKRGWNCLANNFGVPRDAWFVSLHVRYDTVYHESEGTRDAAIETYILAIQSIVSRGGWVVRMGDSTMPQLPVMKNVIDYPHTQYKSDWMDVFLWAKCRFFLGTNSGPAFVPPTFGVPVVVTNWSPLGIPDLFIDGLCIFKNYWSIQENRYLSYPEVLNASFGFTNAPRHIAASGVRLIENTPEEIKEVVIEMLDRLDGNVLYTEDENRRQRRFDRLHNKAPGVGRIGRLFLRNHSHLMDDHINPP